jgi:hypothetical protein
MKRSESPRKEGLSRISLRFFGLGGGFFSFLAEMIGSAGPTNDRTLP